MKKIIKRLVAYVADAAFEITFRENINTFRWRRAVIEAAEFIDTHAPTAQVFGHKHELLRWALGKIPREGLVLEFGVFRGESINLSAKLLRQRSDNRKICGFDAFLGLEEDWTGHRWGKGAFSTGGKLPKVADNVELVVGWINETLPGFLDKRTGPLAFIHIDTDTYTPAALTLKLLKDRLSPGSLILFDDFFGYPGWREGEYKALTEVLSADRYRFIGFSNNQALLEIK